MDRYEQLKIIGRGNYGAAHLVVEKATGRKLVVKKVSISEMSDEERKQASQEVRRCGHSAVHARACRGPRPGPAPPGRGWSLRGAACMSCAHKLRVGRPYTAGSRC